MFRQRGGDAIERRPLVAVAGELVEDEDARRAQELEGAQAGLSWETILKKREGYRAAFHQFEVAKVAAMTDTELEALLLNPNLVRNRLKIFATRKNAVVFSKIQQEFGSFDQYLWRYVEGKPQVNHWKSFGDVPASTVLSDAISKDLKQRGMTFVGSTIIYAYLQAVGVVNDHVVTCFRHAEVMKL